MAEGGAKPSVLIVGGLGFVGRHLARHVHENNLASEVRIVDKLLPQLAWLAPEFSEACSAHKFVQADASREQSFPRMFDRSNGAQFDYVINCAGETRISQPEDVYRIRSHALSLALAKEAARRGIRAYVECSTATVYKPEGKPNKEGDKLKPHFKFSKWRLAAEEDLKKISGLNLCVLRFARIYGEYDPGYLTTGICLGRAYKELERPLPFLYARNQLMNTVHVTDVARALWTAAEWRATKNSIPTTDTSTPIIFNIVDHNKTTKGDFADGITKALGIECTFLGSIMTQFAKRNAEEVIDDMNEDTLQVWADLLQEKSIQRPGPISPFLEREMLMDTDLSVDGSLFEQTTGFKYLQETVPPDWIETMVKSYERMGWWP